MKSRNSNGVLSHSNVEARLNLVIFLVTSVAVIKHSAQGQLVYLWGRGDIEHTL